MIKKNTDIAVVGAGGMGALFGAILSENGLDVVLIDCPPSLGKLTLSVLIASRMLLIPLQCEYYPLEGISSITDLMNQLKSSGINKQLELVGVLMTMFGPLLLYLRWSPKNHRNCTMMTTMIRFILTAVSHINFVPH